jgi:hypothetical protein
MVTNNFALRLQQTWKGYQDTDIIVTNNDASVNLLTIEVYNGATEITYSELASGTITFVKDDGNIVQGNLTVNAGNITYLMGTNEIAIPGSVRASIQLYGASEERLTPARFRFHVQDDLVSPSAVESTTEFSILQDLRTELEAIDVVELTNDFNSHKAETVTQIFNVKTGYGAVGNGIANDATAINAACADALAAGGGTIFLPDGQYYVASTITVPAKCTLRGFSMGSDVNESNVQIIGALSLPIVVELNGGGASSQASLRNVSVTRATGVIPAGSIGVQVNSSDYASLVDVNISRHAIGLDLKGNLGSNCERVVVYSVSETYCIINNIVQPTFIDCSFGRNGGENGIVATDVIQISGNADTIKFDNCQINPTTAGTVNGINFKGYTSQNGYIYFDTCHIENMTNVIVSDAETLLIPRLIMKGCSVSNFTTNPFVELNADTEIAEWVISNNIINGTTTLTNGKTLNLSNNRMSGSVVLDLDQAVVIGNTFNTGATLEGVWDELVFACNVFDGEAQVLTDNSTGKKIIFGNVTGGAYVNKNVLSDLIEQSDYVAPELLNSWVNFGGGYTEAGYLKDSMGFVHLRGVIKSGTITAGTILFNLPAGFRPSKTNIFPSISSVGTVVNVAMEISIEGNVRIGAFDAGATFLSLDGITFFAEL